MVCKDKARYLNSKKWGTHNVTLRPKITPLSPSLCFVMLQSPFHYNALRTQTVTLAGDVRSLRSSITRNGTAVHCRSTWHPSTHQRRLSSKPSVSHATGTERFLAHCGSSAVARSETTRHHMSYRASS